MEKRFFCCVNVWIEEEDGLSQWLQAFEDDKEFLKKSLLINLLDGVDSEQTRAAAADFCSRYPKNVRRTAMPGAVYPQCYNPVLQDAKLCDCVNHTTTAAHIKASDLKKMKSRTDRKTPALIFSFYPIAIQPDGSRKPYLPFPAGNYHRSNSRFDRFSMYLPGCLIKSKYAVKESFDENAPADADVLYLVNMVFRCKDYLLTDLPLVSEEPFENDYYNYRRQFDPAWYTETMQKVYLPLLKAHPRSEYIKTMVMYQIGIRFACNRNDRSKNLLQGSKLDEFFEVLSEVLACIEDNLIVTYNINNMKMLPKYMGMVFLRIKYENPELMPTIANDGTPGNYVAVYRKALVDTRATLKLAVTCMDYDSRTKELVIDGRINNVNVFDYGEIQAEACFGGRTKPLMPTAVYSLEKYFGISVYKDYTFQVRFNPQELKKAKGQITFRFRCGEIQCSLPIQFVKMESKLVDQFPHSYWKFSDYIMTHDAKKQALRLHKRSGGKAMKLELSLYADFLRAAANKNEKKRALKSIALRMAYLLTRPFYRKKQIWLTFDQLFKGGDNGEYFFRYVADHHADKVAMYYIANPDCADYQRLSKTYRNLLPFNSLKAKLMALHASCVFATRVDVKQYCGFGPQLEIYHRGLLTYDVFCLQHGLTIQRIAQYQNRLFDNTKLYFCVSPNEVQNLTHPVYGYDPKSLILTGAPRYDPLISDDKRQILIAPTWRRNVTAGTNRKGHQHEYSINFKDTEYYRIYNGLINNKKLIDCARETGYRIIYLVHPILSPQVGDFQGPEQVTILAGAKGDVSYEKMMIESSLMLTDHSGIQFDFAYMRKPLVYYHPDTLPPQYDAGGMDYQTQAFGPVCTNEEQVVDALCAAMRRDCRMEDTYRARADAFFAFDDHNNCKRIYEAAAKHQGLKP